MRKEQTVVVKGQALEGLWTVIDGVLGRQAGMETGCLIRDLSFTLVADEFVTAIWAVMDMGQAEMDVKVYGWDGNQRMELSMRETARKPETVPDEVWDFARRSFYDYTRNW